MLLSTAERPVERLSTRALVGAAAWASCVQFFITQLVVVSAWSTPFSLRYDYVSDLGNSTCGPFVVGEATQFVCSPWHVWMNVSFVALGVAVIVGTVLVRRVLPVEGRVRDVGLVLVGLAGPGLVLVGLFPEDVNLPVHKLGAAVQFLAGNAGLVVLGLGMRRAVPRGGAALAVCGALGLVASGLFVAKCYLGLGIGGIERIPAYGFPLALAVLGTVLLLRHSTSVR
jgi:hypothetical membrane protein